MTNHAEDYFSHVEALAKHHGLKQDGTPLDTHPEIEVTFDAVAAFWTGEGYMATFGSYDLDCTYGTGKTPLDAIVDLLDKSED